MALPPARQLIGHLRSTDCMASMPSQHFTTISPMAVIHGGLHRHGLAENRVAWILFRGVAKRLIYLKRINTDGAYVALYLVGFQRDDGRKQCRFRPPVQWAI